MRAAPVPLARRLRRAGAGALMAVGALVVAGLVLNALAAAYLWLRTPAGAPCVGDACGVRETLAPERLRFRPESHRGRTVTIDDDGWRPAPGRRSAFEGWSPDAASVFVFGGSTVFGVNVTDAETLPAQLATRLGVAVYNLGQPGARLPEEVDLLVELLRQGRRPTVAVFYDGVNEQCFYWRGYGLQSWRADPRHAALDAAVRLANRAPAFLPENTALGRVLLRVRDRVRAWSGGDPLATATGDDYARVYAEPAACAARYHENAAFVRELGRAYGFRPLFVLQPSGAFLPDPTGYPYPIPGAPTARRVENYRALYARILAGGGVEDLSDALVEPAARGLAVFTDWQHLSAAGNGIVADRLAPLVARA
ncbi:MAG: hypothetical protein FJ027_17900, partial [Candidatus Rokubacteria bacterium]|nr:hypothetical protein [Candidatus Rokubacteria bacterium]